MPVKLLCRGIYCRSLRLRFANAELLQQVINKTAKQASNVSCDYLVVLIFSSCVFFYESESKWKDAWEGFFNEPKRMRRRLDLMSHLNWLDRKATHSKWVTRLRSVFACLGPSRKKKKNSVFESDFQTHSDFQLHLNGFKGKSTGQYLVRKWI